MENARLWSKVRPTGFCWEWIGATNKHGYGTFHVSTHVGVRAAHRVVYETLVGSVSDDLDMDHLCRNPNCVNPDHLEPVSRSVNILRGLKGFALTGKCRRGHPVTPENIYTSPSGTRVCRECRKERDRKRHERDKEKRNAATRKRYWGKRWEETDDGWKVSVVD